MSWMVPLASVLAFSPGAPTTAAVSESAVFAARGVLERTIGPRTREFDLSVIPPDHGRDVFIVSAADGRVRVAGSSGVALARGAYEYLRRACGAVVTWEGSRIDLPPRLPDLPQWRVVCPNRFRHYFNVCTFGYTTAWWDWERWQREIDWMALHGINMPLAMNGQEWVWRDVWRGLGLTDEELAAFFTGPAFLPWHRMGNINAHGGPLPLSWMEKQRDLQKRILQRQRELGMTPVLPAFSGFVPEGLRRIRPDARVRRSTPWCGFPPTNTLDARDPLFVEIGRRFITTYRNEFGTDHFYLADTFNEMTPPVEAATKLADLAAYGEAVFRSIRSGDPRGTWVMQGWLFLNERQFWGTDEVAALLRPVPNDGMILLDLACEIMPVWKAHAAFRRKQWIACTLHNFGQNTALFGSLADCAARPAATLADAGRGNLVGMGLTMEGIEQNAVLYELLCDSMWQTEPIDPDRWLAQWRRCRYGVDPESVRHAWGPLCEMIYGGRGVPDAARYVLRPSLERGSEPGPDLEKLRTIVAAYLRAADELAGRGLFERDLVDLGKRYLEECGGALLYRAMTAWEAGDAPAFDAHAARYLDLLADLDELLGTRPEYRMSAWIAAARRWGDTPAERDLYERNARLQVTVWGGPVLHDYAAKEWQGLTAAFYAERWRRLFDVLRTGLAKREFDAAAWDRAIAEWEEQWTRGTAPLPAARSSDAVAVMRRLAEKYGDVTESAAPPRGIAVGKAVRVSGGTEGGHKPEYAVDGLASNQELGWYASPYPQWLEVDLGNVVKVGRIDLHAYCDGQRYYQYTIEASPDGAQWTRVVDQSRNVQPARRRGTQHVILPTPARYLRLNMLYNSANVGVHVLELRVFPATASGE